MAKDIYHDIVKQALINSGWVITHDPYIIDLPEVRPKQEIDLGAEKIIAAEKETEKIAVEIKSFLNASLVYDFHQALGQFLLYIIGLKIKDPDRQLFLAIPVFAHKYFENMQLIQLAIEKYSVSIIVFNPEDKSIEKWIK